MSEEIKEVLDGLGRGFEEFKAENSKRLDEIEKNGHADPLLQEKVDKMSVDLASMAETKQTIELQQKNIDDANEKIEKLETVIARPSATKTEDVDIQMKAFKSCVRKDEEDEMEMKA